MRHFLALLALGLAACGSDGTGPVEKVSPSWDVTVTLQRIAVVGACEEAFTDIDGGEFSYIFSVFWADGYVNHIAATNAYPSAAGMRRAIPGTTWTFASPTVKRTITPSPGSVIRVVFRATEWDYDLFGNNPFPDRRMNDRNEELRATFGEGGWTAASVPIGPGGVSAGMNLRESTACHVRADVDVSAVTT